MNDLGKEARKYNPSLKEKLSSSDDEKEEARARTALEHFVTDPEGSIYAITPYVPELFSALLKARYSRTELSARQLLWREFIANKKISWKVIDRGMAKLQEAFDYQKAEPMAERILAQYGDDSVFELGGAHIFFDRISQMATKVIEDVRIGTSPLEKSTRYVIFDKKGSDGDYAYFKDPRIMDSPMKDLYVNTNRRCFDFYAQCIVALQDYFRKQVPMEGQKFPDFSQKDEPQVPFDKLSDEKSIKKAHVAYHQSIKAKACDVARVLLPASTLTNVGEFGNARALSYMMMKLKASSLAEMQMIGEEGTKELQKVMPKFFDAVDNSHGLAYQEYLRKTEIALEKRAKKILKGQQPDQTERVILVNMDKDPEVNIVAGLLYPYANLPLAQLVRISKEMGSDKRGEVLHDSLKFRTNRRHKPPRGFEIAGYELVFDILGNFGIYRDLQRQRMLTQQRQRYTTEHGFDMPLEFSAIGLDKEFINLMDEVRKSHDKIAKIFPLESQYVTTMANYIRWYMGMNLREGFWVTELRTIPQGHFSYRTIAQEMARLAQKRYPFLKDLENGKEEYVNNSDYSDNLERLEAMQHIQKKLTRIEDKYS